uniref:Uncharacterized protein n=1 Tax=Oryza barthii TaxID=65489 RepID=A0A0D3HSN9_9ORYZ
MGWTTTRSGAAEWRKQQTAREESSSAACRVIVLLQLGQQRPTVAASIGVGLAVDAAQEWLADGGADDDVDDRALRRLWRVHQLGGEALETEHLVVVHDYGVDEHTELVVVHQGVRAAAARTESSGRKPICRAKGPDAVAIFALKVGDNEQTQFSVPLRFSLFCDGLEQAATSTFLIVSFVFIAS